MFTPDNIGSYKAVKRYWSTDASVGSAAPYFADNINLPAKKLPHSWHKYSGNCKLTVLMGL